uniref:Arylsulfatase D n=1 Tax=Scleropages formosus TaxID=113540 RepID=A0A8C9TX92_SCLFO
MWYFLLREHVHMSAQPVCGCRFCVWLTLLSVVVGKEVTGEHDKPNFVLMMVDDLGIGDVGCYGNDTIRTPNIDRLAQEGVKLTQHIAAAPLCTPSRTAFMTGRYALRSGMASPGRAQVILFLAGSGGLPPNETTFAKLLQKEGYTTGIVGKWHLGVNCEHRTDHCHLPNNHGFDYFYGLPFTYFKNCLPGEGTDVLADVQEALRDVTVLLGLAAVTLTAARIAGLLAVSPRLVAAPALLCLLALSVWYMPFQRLQTWNCIVMRNGDVVEQPLDSDALTGRLVDEAEGFLERHQHKPFLLFLSLAHVHTPLFRSKTFAGRSKHGLYGDNVEEVDWIIGRAVGAVEKLGLSNKTLMYFTSDHGGHIEDNERGGWNGIYRGGKAMGGWEGGIRVPGLFRWTGRLPAGRVIDEPTSLMDVFPTVVGLAGGELPTDRLVDGRDLLPLLEGRAERSEHEFMFHYCGTYLNAVRWRPPDGDTVFKAHLFTPNFFPEGAGGCHDIKICRCHGSFVTYHDPPLLFDLARDPSESTPLTPQSEPRYTEVLRRIAKATVEHRKTLTPVPSQMSWSKMLWRPWLQPCCGTFPFCSCSESKSMNL